MSIEVRCPSCDAGLKAPDAAAGKRLKCPRCESPVPVPATAPAPAALAGVAEYADPPPAPTAPRKVAPAAKPPAAAPPPAADEPAGEFQSDVPDELLDTVRGELTQGERLLWVGRPSPRVMRLRGIGMLVGGCFFAGIGVLLAGVFARYGGVGWPTVVIGTLVGGGGLLGGLVKFAFTRKQAAGTLYALTNRRAVVWQVQQFGPPRVVSYNAQDAMGVWREDNRLVDGAGDVIFKQQRTIVTTLNRRTGATRTNEYVKSFGFLHVDAAREVEKLVREALHIRTRPDDDLPVPDPAALVEAQAAVAGRPLGVVAPFGYAVAAAFLFGPSGVGAYLLATAPAAKPGAFALPGGGKPEEPKKAEPGSPEDWANLLADVGGTDGFRRSAAAERLTKMTPDEHRPEVVKALAGKLAEGHGRDECARALAAWAGPDDAPVLADALKSDSGGVRAAALSGLARLKVPQTADAVAGLLITGKDRDKAKAALIEFGPAAEPAVLPLLDEPKRDTKVDALRVLAKVGTAAALPAVEKISAGSKAKDRGLAKEADDAAKEIRSRTG